MTPNGDEDLRIVDWDSIWRLVRLGGIVIAATFGLAALYSKVDSIDVRVGQLEQHGSVPLRAELQVLNAAILDIRQAQQASANRQESIHHLLCRVPEVRQDSQCTTRSAR